MIDIDKKDRIVRDSKRRGMQALPSQNSYISNYSQLMLITLHYFFESFISSSIAEDSNITKGKKLQNILNISLCLSKISCKGILYQSSCHTIQFHNHCNPCLRENGSAHFRG
jgi:hypothetical protein